MMNRERIARCSGIAAIVLTALLLTACDRTIAPPAPNPAQINPPPAQVVHTDAGKPSAAGVTFNVGAPGIAVAGDAVLVTKQGSYTIGSPYPVQPDAQSLVVIIRQHNGEQGMDTVYRIRSDEDDFVVVVDGRATMRFTNRQALIDVSDAQSKVVEFRLQPDANIAGNDAPTTIVPPTIIPPSTGQWVVGTTVEVNADGLNIRTAPGEDGTLLGSVLRGERLVIVAGPQQVNGVDWWKVSWDAAGDVGWGNGGYLQRVDPAAQEAERQIMIGSTVEVTFEALNIRQAASYDAETLAVVPQGKQLIVTGGPIKVDDRNWWQVSGWENLGQPGWCSERFIRRVKLHL